MDQGETFKELKGRDDASGTCSEFAFKPARNCPTRNGLRELLALILGPKCVAPVFHDLLRLAKSKRNPV